MRNEDLKDILAKGLLAPSADNLQPWRIRVHQNHVDLFVDEERSSNFCDEGLLVPYISAGAVIENMRVAARQLGYLLHPTYFPKEREPLWVATLNFATAQKQNEPHFSALDKRTTNRRFYRGRPIKPELADRLIQLVSRSPGCRLIWLERKTERYRTLADLVGQADQLRFEIQRLHKEFFETLRFSRKQAEETRDGLDFRTLEAGPLGGFLFGLIRSWTRLERMNQLKLSSVFKQYARMQMNSSSAAGLLVAEQNRPLDYVAGGEVMERLWHELTLHGIALQPMEALPIFIINRHQAAHSFTAGQIAKIDALKARFLSLFGINEACGFIMLFRAGYAKAPSTRSLRRPLDSFLFR